MPATNDMVNDIRSMGIKAKAAGRALVAASAADKSAALENLARLLTDSQAAIIAANAKDLEAGAQNGLDAPRLERLKLDEARILSMAGACREIAAMDDPVGAIDRMWKRPNGLLVGKMRIPLGVIATIYESRPNVTVDSAILCLKAGNAVILRGGSEAIHSNTALAGLVQQALAQAGLPGEAVQLVPTTDRAAVAELLKLEEHIDVVIPRGGEGLIRAVVEGARMPVLKHYKGVCHLYVDDRADLNEALEIAYNSKVQRCSVCNALECLLVHKSVAKTFLPRVAGKLGAAGVTFHADPTAKLLLGANAVAATEDDWGKEYISMDLAVKVVADMDEALDHIAANGSGHTENICTTDHNRAMRFTREADASMVGVNCSTRFNDGGELGLGAEIGICTSKLHSYGPMGVTELTTTKFVVLGEGQIRT